jgi:hypothetical protein
MSATIERFALDKTSNLDNFINKLLKACAFSMTRILTSFFDACTWLFYHSKAFKKVNTITLKKANKDDYTISKTYCLIILLNIADKIMKSIMNKKIAWLTKRHQLFFDSHMRCRKNRLTKIVLKLLTEQIHIVWDKKTNRIIILLNLDVIDAFDTISHNQLIHDMRKRKISMWIIDWVNNFLKNRTTTLTINWRVIVSFSMQIEISQNSSLFLIVYLFYNADLLEMCDRLEINTRSLEYANDVNILIYEKNTIENCKNLKRVHKFCEKWAIRHEFVLALIKYEFIYFIRNFKNFVRHESND